MSIELKNVTKKFGEVAAVNNISFSVNEGELMALLGPSGGGKTTVLRMIAGLEMPTDGRHFHPRPARQRRVGATSQHRLRVPELRAVQEHERVQERRLRSENQEMEEGRHRGARDGVVETFRTRRPGKTLSAPAFRRPAPARGHRARACTQAERAAARRTVRRGGRQDPPGTSRMARARCTTT